MSQVSVSSVSPTDSASNAVSQTTDKLKSGGKLDAVKYFFDIPLTRTPGSNVMCKVCQVSYKLQKKSYYNLELHCSKAHTNSWERVLAGGTLNESDGRLQPLLADGFAKAYSDSVFREELWKWAIEDEQAHMVVEHPRLRSIFKMLKPSVKIPGADTLKRDVMKAFSTQRNVLKTEIARNTSKVSLTTDLWTSPNNIAFMAVTAHFIDEDWELVSIVLDFLPFSGAHEGTQISAVIRDIADEFGFKGRILALCCDNATNNDTMVADLIAKGYLPDRESHQRCFCHVLNLAAEDALKEIKSPLEKLRKVIKTVRSSPQRQEKFKNVCESARIKYLKPILDVVTRWNSTHNLLSISLRLKEAIKKYCLEVLSEFPEYDEDEDRISEMDWKNFAALEGFLRPFLEATLAISGDKYATLSLVLPWYNAILDHLETVKSDLENPLSDGRDHYCHMDTDTKDDLLQACTNAYQKFEGYFDISSDYCTLAILVDSRFKLDFWADDSKGAQEVANQQNEAYALLNKVLREQYPGIDPPVTEDGVADVDDRPRIFKKLKTSVAIDEVRTYLKDYPLNAHTVNPLEWWNQHQSEFPRLSRLARDYLAIPGSSASSERVFSGGRRLISDTRSRLGEQTIRAHICLKSWIQQPWLQKAIRLRSRSGPTIDCI